MTGTLPYETYTQEEVVHCTQQARAPQLHSVPAAWTQAQQCQN